jgi:hypothetical protein
MYKILKFEPCYLSSTHFIPLSSENTFRPSGLYIFFFQRYHLPTSLLLLYLSPYPSSSIIKMLSKSFITFITLMITASILTCSSNAAAIAPARQFLYLVLVDWRWVLTLIQGWPAIRSRALW